MASMRCVEISGTGLARTPGDMDHLTHLTKGTILYNNISFSIHKEEMLIYGLHVNGV